jgi:hypothetical protein
LVEVNDVAFKGLEIMAFFIMRRDGISAGCSVKRIKERSSGKYGRVGWLKSDVSGCGTAAGSALGVEFFLWGGV